MGFLDKMKSSVSGVSAQQRYASNIRKINAQIQSNEKEIERTDNAGWHPVCESSSGGAGYRV